MPNQAEAQYLRDKYQGFSSHKLEWSLKIGVITSSLALPFDLLKSRAVILQEGRVVHGWSVNKGVPMSAMYKEIIESGAGLRGFWKGLDISIAKNLLLSGYRTFFWSYTYNIFNKDARSKRLLINTLYLIITY